MKRRYREQVSLLLDVLGIVSMAEVFALKGGTAINFFFLDYPRVSVDIDLHYLPLNERGEALRDIRENTEAIRSGIQKRMPGTEATIQEGTGKVWVGNGDATVKVEINHVIRGTLLPPVEMRLCSSLREEFAVDMKASCVAGEELYAGKFCAALKRQHLRDIFDVLLFFERGGELSGEAVDALVVYLISDRKPVHEILDSGIKDIGKTYEDHFAGMANAEVSVERLREMQNSLPGRILDALEKRHRTFLAGFNGGEPDWKPAFFPRCEKLARGSLETD